MYEGLGKKKDKRSGLFRSNSRHLEFLGTKSLTTISEKRVFHVYIRPRVCADYLESSVMALDLRSETRPETTLT